jgi:glycerol-3-phosphate dehydrogenase
VGRLIPAVGASIELRALLDHYDSDLLVKGVLLLEPWQRAELRRVLDVADSSLAGSEEREGRMSLATKVEAAVEKVVTEVERGVADFDGAALHDARQVIADVQAAEAKGAELAVKYKAEIEALAQQAEGQVAVALTALAEQLAADFASLFATG